MHFRIRGLPAEHFEPLFSMSDTELNARRARRCTAPPGTSYPCRISLTDARPGDEVLLTYYEHHVVGSPYYAGFAVYVRPGEQQFDRADCVPQQLRSRLLALRAYDDSAMMLTSDLTDGRNLEQAIKQLFGDPRATYLHAFYAKPGCYAASIERA
jgi:hypothetical protein